MGSLTYRSISRRRVPRMQPYDAWLASRVVCLLERHDARVRREILSLRNRRVSESMRRYQAQGRRMSWVPPYGWRLDLQHPRRLLPDWWEQQVIAQILRGHVAGLSLRAIAALLTRVGVPCRGAVRWSHQTVAAIMRRGAIGAESNDHQNRRRVSSPSRRYTTATASKRLEW